MSLSRALEHSNKEQVTQSCDMFSCEKKLKVVRKFNYFLSVFLIKAKTNNCVMCAICTNLKEFQRSRTLSANDTNDAICHAIYYLNNVLKKMSVVQCIQLTVL